MRNIDRSHLRNPVPDDFVDLAGRMTVIELCRHYGRCDKLIKRWLRESGKGRKPYVRPGLPLPPDFAQVAPLHNITQLTRIYERSERCVRRWLRISNIAPAPFIREPKEKPQPVERPRRWNYAGPPRFAIPPRDHTIIGQAAETLRRYAAVYRCRENGRADPNGDFFRYGNTVLTPDELIARAEAKGWRLAA